jgi:hypothetical protein
VGDTIVLERPRGREGEVTGERAFPSSRFFSDFEGVECSTGWTFSLSIIALPFSIRDTSGEAYAVDDESSGVEPAEGFDGFVSSSPLDEGEETSLGGGASKATGGLVVEIELVVVEAAEAAERRLFSAVAKTSSVPLELDVGSADEGVSEEDLEPSMRDSTDSTEFLFWAEDRTESRLWSWTV